MKYLSQGVSGYVCPISLCQIPVGHLRRRCGRRHLRGPVAQAQDVPGERGGRGQGPEAAAGRGVARIPGGILLLHEHHQAARHQVVN